MKKRIFFPFRQFVRRGQSSSESATLCCLSYRASTQISAILAQYEKQTEKSDQPPDPRFAVRLILSCVLNTSLAMALMLRWLYSSRWLNFVLLVESCFREHFCLKTSGHNEMSEGNKEMCFYFSIEFLLEVLALTLGKS